MVVEAMVGVVMAKGVRVVCAMEGEVVEKGTMELEVEAREAELMV